MTISLRVKLTGAFLAVSLTLLVLISFFANYLLENQFRDYIIAKQEKTNLTIVSTLEARYADWGNRWDDGGMENIGVNALENGLMLRIMDDDETVLWDAMVHNSGMCASIIQNMAQLMQSRYSDFKGGYVEKIYPLLVGGETVGRVAVGYYGPYFFSDNDIRFLDTLNRLIQIAAAIAMAISLILGAYMARQLAIPIRRVAETVNHIAKGNLGERVKGSSTTLEIIELAENINSLAETLEKQESLRKRLTADVAHELRTPLATLQSHIEAMIDGIWEPDRKRLQSCNEEVVRLAGIVGSLEELTRYDSDSMRLEFTKFDLEELLRRIVSNFESEFRKKEVELLLETSSQIIEGDEDKISQVCINILSNALKYTPAGGSVSIRLDGSDDWITVVFRDTGIGIEEKDLPNIFERFFRVDRSRNRQTGGSGIGLAIVKSIIDAHHGQIEVKSELGKGSAFTVHLPRNPGRTAG